METREQVQKELSEELHDNIGQLLSSSMLLIGVTERDLNYIPETLKTAQETLGKALSDLRALTKSLNNDWLNQFDLVDNLQREVHRLNVSHKVNIQLETFGINIILENSKQLILFRIVQEAINNILKHSNADRINIAMENDGDTLRLTISDNGIPFNLDENKGLGVLTMNNRAKLLNGNLTWENSKEGNNLVISLKSTKAMWATFESMNV